MARDFTDVLDQIIEVGPQNLVDEIRASINFWAPEVEWDKLNEYVNRFVTPSSRDPQSVAVYAILCDCSDAEMKLRFEADNL